ncbi:hypothetical protein ACWGLF_05600 [Streptomyces puniciscabiei]
MPAFRIAPAVAGAFPDTLIALVTATGLRGRESWPHTLTALANLEQQLADETDPRIEAWHTAYRSFGTNPRRVRPSADALGHRMAKKGSLPRINPAVDSYNAVSVRRIYATAGSARPARRRDRRALRQRGTATGHHLRPESPRPSGPDKHDPATLAFRTQAVHCGNHADVGTGAIRAPIVMANSSARRHPCSVRCRAAGADPPDQVRSRDQCGSCHLPVQRVADLTRFDHAAVLDRAMPAP